VIGGLACGELVGDEVTNLRSILKEEKDQLALAQTLNKIDAVSFVCTVSFEPEEVKEISISGLVAPFPMSTQVPASHKTKLFITKIASLLPKNYSSRSSSYLSFSSSKRAL